MTANRSNRRWQNPFPASGVKPAFPLGSQRANSPSWSRARGTTQRPDTREQSNLPPETRSLANEEESIHAETHAFGQKRSTTTAGRLPLPLHGRRTESSVFFGQYPRVTKMDRASRRLGRCRHPIPHSANIRAIVAECVSVICPNRSSVPTATISAFIS